MEKETLIGILRHNAIITCAGIGLTSADFTIPLYRRFYAYAVEIYNAGGTVDIEAIKERSSKNGGLTVIEERALLQLTSEDTDIGAGDAAKAVKDRARRLRLALTLEKAASGLRRGAGLVSTVDSVKQEIERHARQSVSGVTPKEAGAQVLAYFKTEAIVTGWPRLNADFAGGIRPGEVLAIGGRPGEGKSLFCQTLLVNAAKAGCKVGFITLEMSPASLHLRHLSWESKMPHKTLRDKFEVLIKHKDVRAAQERAEQLPITYLEPPAEYGEIVTAVHGLAAAGCRLIAVDYLQLVKIRGFRGNRADELAEVSAGLKNIARRLGIGLIEAVQLRRPHPQAKDRAPEMDDIKDCGAIEQDADFVGLLWQDKAFNRGGEGDLRFIKLLIRKYRNGAALHYITYEFNPVCLDLRECPIGG